MGRKKFRGGRKGGGNRQPPANGGDYRSYPEVPKENQKLENYYNTVLPLGDDERKEFWDALKRVLPNSFRFAGSKGHALAVKRLLETRYIPEIVRIERYDGQPVCPPEPVPWYPDLLAYSMNTPKQIIRKFPPFAAFQKFLVSETSVGNISRQEIVSMIPPLLMDLDPGMTVLDMCAAPGSKAAQLLEMVHVGEEARVRQVLESFGETSTEESKEGAENVAADASDDGRATGMLIANDADYKRSHMLVHQLKRLSSPNLLVTNHDATLYPAIRLPKDSKFRDRGDYLKFDRILADVPCSGDGTLRKNVNIWKDWLPGNALGLHLTQIRILVRALTMLKVGGRVVYSTCSMNPVENEAVIAAAIDRCGGPEKIGIVDCSERLPLLKRYPGMHQWSIMDKSGRIWNNWEEVQQYALTKEDGLIPGRVLESMFPRPDSSESSSLPLDRCMRVYAHQQDTGGFFITVLEKKAEFKAKPEPPAPNAAHEAANGASNGNGVKSELMDPLLENLEKEVQKAAEGEPTDVLPVTGAKRPLEEEDGVEPVEAKKLKTDEAPAETTEAMSEAVPEPSGDVKEEPAKPKEENTTKEAPKPQGNNKRIKPSDGSFEEPFKYLSAEHEAIRSIRDFYKLSPRFPTDRYMVRNAAGEPAKAIYYTSALLREILVENEGRGIKFVHAGVKMFMKQDAPSAEVCRWRIQSEGMPIIAGYVGQERVVRLTNKETFRKLLKEMFPKFIDGEWSKLNEIGERARDIGMGCCLLKVEPDGTDPDFAERMVLPLWKSFHSLNLMLPKEDRAAMLLRMFNDVSPVVNTTLKDNKGAAASTDAKAEDGAEAKAEDAEGANNEDDGEEKAEAENGEDDAMGEAEEAEPEAVADEA